MIWSNIALTIYTEDAYMIIERACIRGVESETENKTQREVLKR